MILGFDSLLYVMNNSIVGTLLSFLVLTQYKILLLLLCLSYSNDLVYAPRRLSILRHTSHQWGLRWYSGKSPATLVIHRLFPAVEVVGPAPPFSRPAARTELRCTPLSAPSEL